MASNLDRFKSDLDKLIDLGNKLQISMFLETHATAMRKQLMEAHKTKEKTDAFIAELPNFNSVYERWYSESIAVLRQLLPDRVSDFIQHYEPSKTRKELTYTTYRIRDYLHSITVTRLGETVVGKTAANSHYQQQLSILMAARARFESSLFDIRQMLQADLMDEEIEAAEHLAKYKFVRAAGAVAGVVLERHLSQVCENHGHKVTKKNPTINDFNELLKSNDTIDVPQWRFIQHLADVRNLCDHSKIPEPTAEQVTDLISGVKKVMKTIN
jgi:hypothetical protein